MKKLLILLLVLMPLVADDKAKLLKLYKKGSYLKACHLGFSRFGKNRHDEAYISLYAYSCLNSDLLDRLATPIVMLKLTPEGRKNGAFLAAILMKKKLLHHALADGYNIQGVKLPASSHILSVVFDLLSDFDGKATDGVYTLQDKEHPNIVYRTFMQRKAQLPKIVIEKYQDSIFKERHLYK